MTRTTSSINNIKVRPLDSLRTLSWFVSYRRLSAQFQFSLSVVTLVYLVSQWLVPTKILYILYSCFVFVLFFITLHLWHLLSVTKVHCLEGFCNPPAPPSSQVVQKFMSAPQNSANCIATAFVSWQSGGHSCLILSSLSQNITYAHTFSHLLPVSNRYLH